MKNVKKAKKGGKAKAGAKKGVKAGVKTVGKVGGNSVQWKKEGVEEGFKEILRNNVKIPTGGMARIGDWAKVLREMTNRFEMEFTLGSLQKKKERLATGTEGREPWDLATRKQVKEAGGKWKEPQRKIESVVFAEKNNGASLWERNEDRFKEQNQGKSRRIADRDQRVADKRPTAFKEDDANFKEKNQDKSRHMWGVDGTKSMHFVDKELRHTEGRVSVGVERGRKRNDRHMAGLLVVQRKLELQYAEAVESEWREHRRRIEATPPLSLADAAVAEAARVAAHVLWAKQRKRNRDDTPKREGRVLAMHKLEVMDYKALMTVLREERRLKSEAAAAGGAVKEEGTADGGGKKRKKGEFAQFVAADYVRLNPLPPGVMCF